MRPLPLVALLVLAGCGGSQGSLANAPRVQHTTTEIESSEGNVYTISQITERNVRTSRVSGTAEEAWATLPDVYRGLEVPVTMVDSRNRMLGTAENRLSRISGSRPAKYLDCGSGLAGQYANIYHVFVTLVTQVEPAPEGGSAVHTQLEAAARDPAHSNNALRCTTKGVLEREIAEALQARLAAAAK